jgi:trimethylamine--corrinoid protein Co-methyltransferase
MLQAMASLLEPVTFSDDDLGLEAQGEISPGGHFFGSSHTMSRYRDAFYAPFLSDWRNNQAWLEAGAPTAQDKATKIWQDMLAAYEKPPLPQDRVEAIDAFVARRKEEIGGDDISG